MSQDGYRRDQKTIFLPLIQIMCICAGVCKQVSGIEGEVAKVGEMGKNWKVQMTRTCWPELKSLEAYCKDEYLKVSTEQTSKRILTYPGRYMLLICLEASTIKVLQKLRNA